MSWTYKQSTGQLTSPTGAVFNGYSGHAEGRNNPAKQDVVKVGVIPQGRYLIGNSYDDPHLGPCVMHLDPTEETNTFGRSLFRIHGNNARNDASEGCVVMPPIARFAVSTSEDKILEVIE